MLLVVVVIVVAVADIDDDDDVITLFFLFFFGVVVDDVWGGGAEAAKPANRAPHKSGPSEGLRTGRGAGVWVEGLGALAAECPMLGPRVKRGIRTLLREHLVA